MDNSEELDYMSDDFLQTAVSEDVRPGLLYSKKKQREHDLLKRKLEYDEKNREKCKKESSAAMAIERLQEGLNQPLGPENKGFKMLQKMGFNPGSGLGATSSGRKDPIPITIKQDRQGLGRDAALKLLREKKAEILMARTRSSQISIEDYRSVRSRDKKGKLVEADLRKAQRVCFNFDQEANIDEPEDIFFWPESETKNEEEEEEGEQNKLDVREEPTYSPDEQLQLVTEYLRNYYFYCLWCGIKFENEEDMRECPGNTRDDH